MAQLEWDKLQDLSNRLSKNEVGPGGVNETEWALIDETLNQLIKTGAWEDIIKLRGIFSFLINGETTGGMPVIMRLNTDAIHAAEKLGKNILLAQYLHDNAENYHRKGYHKESVRDFERAAQLYKQENEYRKSLESYYFSALAYRGLGKRKQGLEILKNVLSQLDADDSWRANPLEVMSWIYRDDEKFALAEETLKTALTLYQKLEGVNNIHAVQTLADLGEVIGRQGRYDEAEDAFNQSLNMVKVFQGQYSRQEARTMIKYAEMLTVKEDYTRALKLLNGADDKIRGYGHYYESMLKIEFARVFAFWGLRQWKAVYKKLQLIFQYRKEIGLPYFELILRLAIRIKMQATKPSQNLRESIYQKNQ